MKKIYVMLGIVALLVTFSCSKSETAAPTPSVDKIVGKWKITSETSQNGINGTPKAYNNPCRNNIIHTFTATTSTTGFWSYTPFSQVNGICQQTSISSTPIVWINLGNNTYQIKYTGGDINETFEFTADGNTMIETDVSGSPTIYKTTYVRQQN